MARRIKFALEMKDGVQVRDIETLREHFDLESVMGYFLNGKLATWLHDRFHEEEARQVEALQETDTEIHEKLCKILGVSFQELDSTDSPDSIRERNKRMERLKQYTNDPDIIEKVDSVAFRQEDLANLLHDGIEEIYLCGKRFTIPLTVENRKYIGIGKNVEATIPSDEPVDFDELGIQFDNVVFNAEYEKICNENSADVDTFLATAKSLMKSRKASEAIRWFEKAAEAGNEPAMLALGDVFHSGRGDVEKDYDMAEKWYLQALESKDKKTKRKAAKKLSDLYKSRGLQSYRAKEPVSKQSNLRIKQKKYYQMALDLGYRAQSSSKTSSSGCFITTAVCSSLNKMDDCYELTTFRKFRDNWLANQPNGGTLINEYYVIAPKIVRSINQCSNAKEIYLRIFDSYLSECLACIEDGQFEKCRNIYIQMVRDLSKKYLPALPHTSHTEHSLH